MLVGEHGNCRRGGRVGGGAAFLIKTYSLYNLLQPTAGRTAHILSTLITSKEARTFFSRFSYYIIIKYYRSIRAMAGYFSNHSQSRFLTNSNANHASSNSVSSTATMTTSTSSQPAPSRLRAMSSRHFSTSVSTNSSGDEKSSTKDKHLANATSNGLSTETLHPLRNTCVYLIYLRPCLMTSNRFYPKIDGFSGLDSSGLPETRSSIMRRG